MPPPEQWNLKPLVKTPELTRVDEIKKASHSIGDIRSPKGMVAGAIARGDSPFALINWMSDAHGSA